jgi:hypothetical protein
MARLLTDPRGRAKVYRPMAPGARAAALAAFFGAYQSGEFFEAHELLEPAWMGSPDESERELLQGLIKLAAAFVHADRGNPAGIVKNLRGARERLAGAAPGEARVDVPATIAAIDDRLARLAAGATHVDVIPIQLRNVR